MRQITLSKADIAAIITALGSSFVVSGVIIAKRAAAKVNLVQNNLFQYPDSAFIDNDVLSPKGKPTIRVMQTADGKMEANGPWLPIIPGKKLTFGCWILCPDAGGRPGVDFYADGGITGVASKDGSQPEDLGNSPLDVTVMGATSWTRSQIGPFYVKDTYVAAGTYGPSASGNVYPEGMAVKPTGIIPWFQVWNKYGPPAVGAVAWFGDPYLYIE